MTGTVKNKIKASNDWKCKKQRQIQTQETEKKRDFIITKSSMESQYSSCKDRSHTFWLIILQSMTYNNNNIGNISLPFFYFQALHQVSIAFFYVT